MFKRFDIGGLKYEEVLKKTYELKEAGKSHDEIAEAFGLKPNEFRVYLSICNHTGFVKKTNAYHELRAAGHSISECSAILKVNESTCRAWEKQSSFDDDEIEAEE